MSARMTDAEVIALMREGGPLEMARRKFSSGMGAIEQAEQQRSRPSIMDVRRMEFDAVRAILEAAALDRASSNETEPSNG